MAYSDNIENITNDDVDDGEEETMTMRYKCEQLLSFKDVERWWMILKRDIVKRKNLQHFAGIFFLPYCCCCCLRYEIFGECVCFIL